MANKWDLVTKDTKTTDEYTRGVLRYALKFADYVPIIFTSAITKQRVGKILELALDIAVERKKRIATPELNSAYAGGLRGSPASRGLTGRRLKLLYVTQAGIGRPPSGCVLRE